jgi:hypothetical protein
MDQQKPGAVATPPVKFGSFNQQGRETIIYKPNNQIYEILCAV